MTAPPVARTPTGPAAAEPDAMAVGYYGLPLVKPPVWQWQIGLYFFVGGIAGMSGVLALAMLLGGRGPAAMLAPLAIAVVGAAISAVLLIMDLGRPRRFLYMLRVCKLQSPMSVGVWVLTLFGGAVTPALACAWLQQRSLRYGDGVSLWQIGIDVLVPLGALSGAVVGTYTGVLIGSTVIPAWHSHRRLLPLHFGVDALGSAAAVLELLGAAPAPLAAIGWIAAGSMTAIAIYSEVVRVGAVDRALRQGSGGALLRAGHLLAALALAARAIGWPAAAAALFLGGSLLGRYGWLAAGRASALDPEATLAEQRARRA